MNTFIVLSALVSAALAIPTHSYGGYDGGYGGGYGGDYGKGAVLLSSDMGKGYGNDDHSYTTYTKVVSEPIITKQIRYEQPMKYIKYEEPTRATVFHRSEKMTPIFVKKVVKPIYTKTYTTKSYEMPEPKYISSYNYGGDNYGDDHSYGSQISYGKVLSYGKGY